MRGKEQLSKISVLGPVGGKLQRHVGYGQPPVDAAEVKWIEVSVSLFSSKDKARKIYDPCE